MRQEKERKKRYKKTHTQKHLVHKFSCSIIIIIIISGNSNNSKEKYLFCQREKLNNAEKKQILRSRSVLCDYYVSSLTFPFLWHKNHKLKSYMYGKLARISLIWFNWNEIYRIARASTLILISLLVVCIFFHSSLLPLSSSYAFHLVWIWSWFYFIKFIVIVWKRQRDRKR